MARKTHKNKNKRRSSKKGNSSAQSSKSALPIIQHGLKWGRVAKYIPLFLLLVGVSIGTNEWLDLYNNANAIPSWLAITIPITSAVICYLLYRLSNLKKIFAVLVVLGIFLSLWIPRGLRSAESLKGSDGWCQQSLWDVITSHIYDQPSEAVSIAVARFKGPGQGSNTDTNAITDTIINRLRRETKDLPEVEIRPLVKVITEEDNLQEVFTVLRKCNTEILIWGFYDERMNVTAHIERLREASTSAHKKNLNDYFRLEFDYNSSVLEKREITVKDVLSGDMNFFALFIAGLIRYEAKDLNGALLRFSKAQEQNTSSEAALFQSIFSYFLGNIFYRQGKYLESAKNYRKALELNSNDVETVNNLALSLDRAGSYSEAETYFKQAVGIAEKEEEPQRDIAPLLNNFGALYYRQRNYKEAEPLLKRALTIIESEKEPEPLTLAGILSNLAAIYSAQNRTAEAESFFKRALTILEKAVGPEHPTVGVLLSNIAGIYRTQTKYAEAEEYLKRALAIEEKALGPEHPDVATIVSNLASLYSLQKRLGEAEPLFRRALAILERNLGPEHPDAIIITIDLGELYSEQNRIAEAESLFRRALKSEKVLRHNPLKIAQALEGLGGLYFTQTKYAEAEPLFSGALAIKEKELGATHIDLVPTLNYLGGIHIAKGNLANAEPLIKRALKITEKEGGNYDLVVGALNLYAGVLRKMGRNEEASIFEKRADKIKSNQGNQN